MGRIIGEYFFNYCSSGIESAEGRLLRHRNMLNYSAKKKSLGSLSTGEISGHLAININLGDVAYALNELQLAEEAYLYASADAEAVGDIGIQCKVLERLRLIRIKIGPLFAESNIISSAHQYYKILSVDFNS